MKNTYSLSEKVSNLYFLIITKLFYKKARLIRRPFYCRGKKNLYFETGFTTGRCCRFDLPSEKNKTETLSFGVNCRIGDYVHIVAHEQVRVGNNVLLASNIFISDTSHGDYKNTDYYSNPDVPPNERPLISKKVSIGDNVWIGENVVILLGVDIGNGCIIGANSVVTKSIPSNSIVTGSPARVIKKYDGNKKEWVKI